jgi:Outer membrane protein beta-barrel domain
MKHLIIASCCGLLAAGMLAAQEKPGFTFSIGAGFAQPTGNTGRNLDDGWNIRGGAGLNFTPYLGAMLDLGYDHMGINGATLANIGVPGGDVQVFSATVDPVVHLNPHGHFDLYLTGGGGLFHWYQEFTQPSVGVVPGFDPFFGFYSAAVPTNQVLASYSVNRPGFDVGAGIAFGTRTHGKFFAEARYDHIYMMNSHADYIPVTFGFRW